uniref:BACK domain-containing protein n=2 Tax=Anopheles atroparvus TaxID=41427 RepID=A0A182ISH4_ANOAO
MVLPFNTTEANTGRPAPLPTAPPMASLATEAAHIGAANYSSLTSGADEQFVDFLVLGNKENYLVRADRKAILDSNTDLARMLTGGGGSGGPAGKCVVRDVKRDNFETFVRYLETCFIKFVSPTHTLEMLELATRYQCRQLEIYCVKELDLNLSVEHVLEVYRALWFYNSVPSAAAASAAPGAGAGQRRNRCCPRRRNREAQQDCGPVTPEEHFAALLANCLQLIDMHAEQVFSQEAMLALHFPELEMIVKRDALQLSSETVLLDLLARWSLEDCRRKNVHPSAENRRRALGALCYAPRYLTMTRREFEGARERIELLDPVESQLVGDILIRSAGGKPSSRKTAGLTPEQQALVARFQAPRPAFALLPIPLSSRSQPRNYPKKMRKAAEEAERERDGAHKKGCCDRMLLNCVSVFACIFA